MIHKGVPRQSMEGRRMDVTKIIYALREARTIDQVCRLFFNKNFITEPEKKYIKNRLQIIKVGSYGIIHSNKRKWQIDPRYVSGPDELIKTIIDNYGLEWQQSLTNQRRRAECAARGTSHKKISSRKVLGCYSKKHRPGHARQKSFMNPAPSGFCNSPATNERRQQPAE